jgi:DNA-binding GntR family transcriptional regulator
MRANNVFKRAYNQILAALQAGDATIGTAPEVHVAERFGVSRTTVRGLRAALDNAGLLRNGMPGRAPVPADYYPDAETESIGTHVERCFMEWILHADCRPGQLINASQLARQFGTSTTAVREYLHHFQHYGLLDRRPNSSWVFNGITGAFAEEICEIREMFELRSARFFGALPLNHPAWARLKLLKEEHLALLSDISSRYRDFSRLDQQLHRLIHDAASNRFVVGFHHVLSLIFHYHYQWDKTDERERNMSAIHEHIAYIDALESRDIGAIEAACRTHLRSARKTLLDSAALKRDWDKPLADAAE